MVGHPRVLDLGKRTQELSVSIDGSSADPWPQAPLLHKYSHRDGQASPVLVTLAFGDRQLGPASSPY